MKATRIEQIHKRIERIKAELAAIDEMRPGSLSKQFKNPILSAGRTTSSTIHKAGEVELSM